MLRASRCVPRVAGTRFGKWVREKMAEIYAEVVSETPEAGSAHR
jgi:hypothetical protein